MPVCLHAFAGRCGVLVDAHCHLQDPKLRGETEAVLARAREAGVSAAVVCGYDMESSRQAVDLADSHENLYAVIGVHPHDAKDCGEREMQELERLADSAKVVGIGETGLDYYRNLSPAEDQRRAFCRHLDLAARVHLPIVIHAREADEETFEVLSGYEQRTRGEWPKDRPLGMMHCFAGDLPLALRYIEMGFVISIPGTCTYPNADKTRAVAGGIPLRWMTVETDAPYLPPQTYRGQRNEPAYIAETVRFIAGLRGVSFDEVADRTALTAAGLFGLGDIGRPSGVPAREQR